MRINYRNLNFDVSFERDKDMEGNITIEGAVYIGNLKMKCKLNYK
jgi:hypothetical protein